MARPEDKKNLSGDIPEQLHTRLSDWIDAHKNVKIRQCLEAMTELWLLLPERLTAVLLCNPVDTPDFGSAVSRIEKDVTPYEDLLRAKDDEAPVVVRRLLLLLQDYARTRNGITTTKDLQVALEAMFDLLQWIDLNHLEAATDADCKAVREIVHSLQEWRYGEKNAAEIWAAKDTANRVVPEVPVEGDQESPQREKAGKKPESRRFGGS